MVPRTAQAHIINDYYTIIMVIDELLLLTQCNKELCYKKDTKCLLLFLLFTSY